MKRKKLVKRRNLNFQTLDARLAFDADSGVSELQIDETGAFDVETVDLSTVSGDFNGLGMVASFSVGQSELVEDGDAQEFVLQEAELQRFDDLPAEDIDVTMMTFGSIQFDFDTNNDGALAAADALLVVNALNARNVNLVASLADDASDSSKIEMNVELDINRDGMLSPIDALLVINALNHQASIEAASIVADESPSSPADLLSGDLTEVTDSNSIEVDSLADLSPLLSMMRIAGANEVKIDGVSGLSTIALSFDAEGKIVANAGDEAVEVTIDENNALLIAGEAVPVAIDSIGDSQQFVPYPIEDETINVTWPWSYDVDTAIAFM